MKTKPNDNMKQLVARIPEEVHRALKIRAAENGKSVAVIVEGLIREYLVAGKTYEGEVTVGGRHRKTVEMLKDVAMDGKPFGRADLPGGGVVLRGKAKAKGGRP